VADGVGSWALKGIDAGLYSKQLCRDIKSFFDDDTTMPLKDILVESAKINKNIGSSTCVLLKFHSKLENHIQTTNLGDSGYYLFRLDYNGELEQVFRSQEQQWAFNTPY
jgi:protein phosphatase PTC7